MVRTKPSIDKPRATQLAQSTPNEATAQPTVVPKELSTVALVDTAGEQPDPGLTKERDPEPITRHPPNPMAPVLAVTARGVPLDLSTGAGPPPKATMPEHNLRQHETEQISAGTWTTSSSCWIHQPRLMNPLPLKL